MIKTLVALYFWNLAEKVMTSLENDLLKNIYLFITLETLEMLVAIESNMGEIVKTKRKPLEKYGLA